MKSGHVGRASELAGLPYDTIAACIGSAYRAAAQATRDLEARTNAVRDLENRIVLECQLENPRFDADLFAERVQWWSDRASVL